MLFRFYSEKLTEKTLENRTFVQHLVSFKNFVQITESQAAAQHFLIVNSSIQSTHNNSKRLELFIKSSIVDFTKY